MGNTKLGLWCALIVLGITVFSSCSSDDNQNVNEENPQQMENVLEFKGNMLPLTSAEIFEISPFQNSDIRGYELSIRGAINGVDHVLRFEIYPPNSSLSDPDLTFGDFNTGGTSGGFEAFIFLNVQNGNPGDQYSINTNQNETLTIMMNDNGDFTVSSTTGVTFNDLSFEESELAMFNYTGPISINN